MKDVFEKLHQVLLSDYLARSLPEDFMLRSTKIRDTEVQTSIASTALLILEKYESSKKRKVALGVTQSVTKSDTKSGTKRVIKKGSGVNKKRSGVTMKVTESVTKAVTEDDTKAVTEDDTMAVTKADAKEVATGVA